MPDKYLNLENFVKELIINTIASIVVAALIWIISKNLLLGGHVFLLLSILLIIYLLVRKRYCRLFKVMMSGVSGYYYTFDYSENSKIFLEPQKSFCYLGISSNSIMEYFRQSITKNPRVIDYRFLLMDPDAPMLKTQIAFEEGVSLDTQLSSLNKQMIASIEQKAEAERKRIISAIETLKSLHIKEGRLTIRLHKEFVPWWMYLIDDKKIFLGILEIGKRGHESPVMVITRHPDFCSPFDAFMNVWENMWANSTIV